MRGGGIDREREKEIVQEKIEKERGQEETGRERD